SGREIGCLAHLPNQRGPLMADAGSCVKHRIAEASHPEGIFRECAGHIATDAFFKVAGDADFDGPWHFQPENTEVGVGSGREHRAEIKFDPTLAHSFQGKQVLGRWVVTYKVPLWDYAPPTWRPREDPPYVIDRNLAAPSHDWVPPEQPDNDDEDEAGEHHEGVAEDSDYLYPGPVVSSTGYAVLDEAGHPDPALGGGVAVMPGGVFLKDGYPFAFYGVKRWFVLHPDVGLGFGLPDQVDDGAPLEGYRLEIKEGALVLSASAFEGEVDPASALRVEVPIEPMAGFQGDAPSVSGSRASGAALASLLSALAGLGLIVDETSF
ncbi:MAG: hypothetical protein KDB07_12855, partial [Planctomycetes bacterium]|nr:hypothetical protein [Planctomycetota bacterium]